MNELLAKKKKTLIISMFLIINSILTVFNPGYIKKYGYRSYNPILLLIFIICVLLSLLILNIFSSQISSKKQIYANKKIIIPFVIIYISFSIIALIGNRYSNYGLKSALLIASSILFSTLLIMHLFKLRLKFFNWSINKRQAVIVIVIFVIAELIPNSMAIDRLHIGFNSKIIYSLFSLKKLMGFMQLLIWPAFYEELLYRGLFISLLKGYNLDEYKINIIQSLVFGIGHYSLYFYNYGWISLLMTSGQVVLGYVFGKLYFKTKSLMPCIILHALVDLY